MCSNTQSFFEGVNNSFEGVNNSLHYPPICEQRKGGRQGGGSGTVGRGVGRTVGRTVGNLRAVRDSLFSGDDFGESLEEGFGRTFGGGF